MDQLKIGRSWWLSAAVVFVVVLVATAAVVGVAYLRHREVDPDDVDCTRRPQPSSWPPLR